METSKLILPIQLADFLSVTRQTSVLTQFADPDKISITSNSRADGWCASLHWMRCIVESGYAIAHLQEADLTQSTCLLKPFLEVYTNCYQQIDSSVVFADVATRKLFQRYQVERALVVLAFIAQTTYVSKTFNFATLTNFYLSIPTNTKLRYAIMRKPSVGDIAELRALSKLKFSLCPPELKDAFKHYLVCCKQIQELYVHTRYPAEVYEFLVIALLLKHYQQPLICYTDTSCSSQMILEPLCVTYQLPVKWICV